MTVNVEKTSSVVLIDTQDPEYLLESEIRLRKAARYLDHGYVRLDEVYGNELKIVNTARASFAKRSTELSGSDVRLLNFLAKNGHSSPMRHCFLSFEVSAPLEVARQMYKYVIGSEHSSSAWNEASRRYITLKPEFYIPGPEEWRSTPDNMKQGSGGPIDPLHGAILTERLMDYIDKGESLYNYAMDQGVAPEMARLFLPAYGMYTTWHWTASVQAVAHFVNQRLEEGAQSEIASLARIIYRLALPHFPNVIGALVYHDID